MAVDPLQADSVRTNPPAPFWALHRAYQAAQGAWLADDGEEAERDARLSAAACSAERALMVAPAPSAAAVLAKARILLLGDDARAMLPNDHIAAILADLDRLALIEATGTGADHGHA